LAALTLHQSKPVYEALRFLEQGNTVILSSIIDCRNDVSDLQRGHPKLFERLDSLRREVDLPGGTDKEPLGNPDATEKSKRRRREHRVEAVSKLELVLKEIRSYPEYTDFLQPPSEEKIQKIAAQGPIVVVNSSFLMQRADAIIITETDIRSIKVQTSYLDDLESSEDREGISMQSLYTGPFNTLADRNESLMRILNSMWDKVIGPIFENLKITASNSAEQVLPHVWWIGSGFPFNTAAFHACGYHEPGSMKNTFSYAVSSYVPSLKALSYAREKKLTLMNNKKSRLLLVTMPETPGAKKLRYVEEEAAQIRSTVVPQMEAVVLTEASPTEVLSEMRDCQAVHFACHGATNSHDPFNSSLLLCTRQTLGTSQEEPPKALSHLRVRDIAALNLRSDVNMDIAYLSACSTANNQHELLGNEAIHLASGFQLAGFAHVIATLWNANDRLCARISQNFWQNLVHNSPHSNSSVGGHEQVSRALHKALKTVKEEHWDEPLLWAPFAHFGA
jgi:hypothetical protein